MESILIHGGGDDTEWMVWCPNMWFTRDILTMSYSGLAHKIIKPQTVLSPLHQIKHERTQDNVNLIFIANPEITKKIAIWQTCRRRGTLHFHKLHKIHNAVTPYMHKFIFTIENTYENNNYNYLLRIHDKTKIFIDTHMWPTGSSTERSICACVAPITLTSCRGVHKMAEMPPQIGGKYELKKFYRNCRLN